MKIKFKKIELVDDPDFHNSAGYFVYMAKNITSNIAEPGILYFVLRAFFLSCLSY